MKSLFLPITFSIVPLSSYFCLSRVTYEFFHLLSMSQISMYRETFLKEINVVSSIFFVFGKVD